MISVLAFAACTPEPSHPQATGAETPLPAPIAVCVDIDGRRVIATATPSRAGVYDPHGAVDPKLLNWTVAGVGCVTYPGPDRPRETCEPGRAPLPMVARVLCGQ